MKKIVHIIAGMLCLAALSSCDGIFKLDNFDGPNAAVSGRIVDALTQAPVPADANQRLIVVEQGWDAEADQSWRVRYDGTFTNNLVFAGNYKVAMRNLPCFDPVNVDFTLNEGNNRVTFEVEPYARIKDVNISYEAAKERFVAKFKVELSERAEAEGGVLQSVVFGGNTQKFINATTFNLASEDPKALLEGTLIPNREYTLYIDAKATGKNPQLFKYKRPLYFRVAALVKGGFNSSNLYNYSETFAVTEDYQTVTVVNFHEE